MIMMPAGFQLGASMNIASGIPFAVMETRATDKGTDFAASHNYTLGMSPTAGDILIAAFNGDVATWSATPVSGWTTLLSQNNLAVVWKTAVAETSSTVVTISSGTGHRSSGAFWRISGGGTPVHAAGTPGSAMTASIDPPNITPAGGLDDYIFLAICGWTRSAGMGSTDPACTAAPTNYTSLVTAQTFPEAASGARGGISGAYRQLNQVTSENPGIFTFVANPAWGSTCTVAIPSAL